jgi:cyclopropane fatty-acyl-phospholipid synthase-like methyltransferase
LALLKPGQSVLDIGCGNGKLVSGLPEGVKYTGTDFSKTLLEEAKKLYPQHDFRYGDVVESDHWEPLGMYDAIFAVAVLHHIPERDQHLYILRQAKAHLNKNGYLYLTVWNLSQMKFAQYKVSDHFEIPYKQDLPAGRQEWKRYCVSFDIQTLTDLATEAGLGVQDIFYADLEGKRSDIINGQNLVLYAR